VIETSGRAVMPQGRRPRHHWRFGPHNLRMGFRRWRRTRPFWGGLWAILGGLIIAAGPASAVKLLIAAGTTIWLGVLVGVLISIFGLFLWFAPQQRHLFGVLTAVLSVVSLITSDFGGFAIGMLLGITGGAMGFAWVPAAPKVRKHRFLRRRAGNVPAADGVIPVVGAAVEGIEAPTIAVAGQPQPVREDVSAVSGGNE